MNTNTVKLLIQSGSHIVAGSLISGSETDVLIEARSQIKARSLI